jgi:hypothetical protein
MQQRYKINICWGGKYAHDYFFIFLLFSSQYPSQFLCFPLQRQKKKKKKHSILARYVLICGYKTYYNQRVYLEFPTGIKRTVHFSSTQIAAGNTGIDQETFAFEQLAFSTSSKYQQVGPNLLHA